MAHKVLIMGGDKFPEIALEALRKEHGADIIVLTSEEAKEQGLKTEDFKESFKLTAPPIHQLELGYYRSGQENRRERRKKKFKNR